MNNDLIFRIAKTFKYHELIEVNEYIKRRIYYIKNKNKISVKDWIELNSYELGFRCYNSFKLYCEMYPNDTINDVTRERAFKVRGIGMRTWNEFKKIRGEGNL
jgi:hypothetical protein